MWIYDSPVGEMLIKRLPTGKYGLFFNDDLKQTSHSADALADNVFTHTSEIDEWDFRPDEPDDPQDLSEWEKK